MMPETEGQSGREVRQSQGLILFLVVSGVAASVTGLVVSQGVVARVAFGVTLGLSLVYLGVVRRLCQIILPVLAEYRANDQKVQSLRTQIATLDSQLAGARVELEQARLLGELVRQISEANDLERVLAVVLRRSMEVFSVQHGFIMLNDKESPGYLKVVAAASNDPQPSLPSGRVRIGEGIAGWVAQTGQPYLHNPGEEAWKGEEGGAIRRRLWQAAETSVGRAFPETARREPPPSNLLCVPILHGPRPIGVITLEERRTGPFVPREAEFLSLIGRELSGAIDKARLQDEIQELSITDELTGLPNRR
jgi:transcriptional regulator with GAF, ATPase, and Fis domain